MAGLSESSTFSLCVFCGSREGDNPQYARAAAQVGQWLGKYGHTLVYGGGSTGLMGVVSEATLQAGGLVTGIIPKSLVQREVARDNCTVQIVTQTMRERKARMLQEADAILTLPGGIGTFEELFEFWTLAQLGYHNKPMAVLNAGGYYDELIVFLQQTMEHDFTHASALDLITVGHSASSLCEDLYRQHHERLGTAPQVEQTGVWAEGDRFDSSQPMPETATPSQSAGDAAGCPFSGGQDNSAVKPEVGADPAPPPQCPMHKS